ncbi:DUF6527 family protein [Shinella sp. JR1-6]|uniref:DUF6527 family protein n=1 Tax=Shinella sp. JR1-6 TaxID=2527671 RepID=UPI00102D3EF6|nr:DUF6527 family protein [Shinella sp. JR1-6]TAA54632.1 ammonia monooxygenase [Shinella sp. JR1-6]
MAALSRKLRSLEGGGIAFACPGCGEMHQIRVGAGPGPRWTFTGDAELPTFRPSILVMGVNFDQEQDWSQEDVKRGVLEIAAQERRCHSFVTLGNIEFLPDSTHDLAGQTVPLPDLQ